MADYKPKKRKPVKGVRKAEVRKMFHVAVDVAERTMIEELRSHYGSESDAAVVRQAVRHEHKRMLAEISRES